MPIGTVRSRLHRARCELRDRLRCLVDEEQPVQASVADGTLTARSTLRSPARSTEFIRFVTFVTKCVPLLSKITVMNQ